MASILAAVADKPGASPRPQLPCSPQQPGRPPHGWLPPARNASSPGYAPIAQLLLSPLHDLHRRRATSQLPSSSSPAADLHRRRLAPIAQFLLSPLHGMHRRRATLTAMTNAPLTVYTTSWCGFCHRLMTVLKSNGIPYDAVDIEHDPAAAEFVSSVNGGNRTVPR